MIWQIQMEKARYTKRNRKNFYTMLETHILLKVFKNQFFSRFLQQILFPAWTEFLLLRELSDKFFSGKSVVVFEVCGGIVEFPA